MQHVEAGLAHPRQHRLRGRRPGDDELHLIRKRALLLLRRVEQGRHHHGRAAHVRDAVLGHQAPHRLAAHRAQADMGAGDGADRPGEAPAVAVEHRQRPEVDGMPPHAGRQHVACRQQLRAAMVVHHALRPARGAGGVVEGDRVPLVAGHLPCERRIALGQQRVVVQAAERVGAGRPGRLRVVHLDDQRRGAGDGERGAQQRRELPVHDHRLGLAVAEDVGDRVRVQPRVDCVQHRAGHGHAVVRLHHLRDVRQDRRHHVAPADPALRQRRGEAAAAVAQLAVAPAQRAVDDGDVVGEHRARALQEEQRRQRLVVGGAALQAGVEVHGLALGPEPARTLLSRRFTPRAHPPGATAG